MERRERLAGAARDRVRVAGVAASVLWLGLACADSPAPSAEVVVGAPGSWQAAAAMVEPSVHSVWGSRPALGGQRLAFSPLGTAFAVTREGALLTSAHILTGEDGAVVPRLSVLVPSDTATLLYGARVLALDAERDLALLAIPDSTLEPVRWAPERTVMGAPLATIGYGLPEGGIVDTTAESTQSEFRVSKRFTAGYASRYRTLVRGDPSTNVLEVDLFLFPGMSGGPTFDAAGGVLGVNQRYRKLREGVPTPVSQIVPRFVVGQFLELQAAEHGVDTLRVFHGTASSDP